MSVHTRHEVARFSPRTATALDLLPERLSSAVGRAYLCLRAIDEIEDHRSLPNARKVELLDAVQTAVSGADTIVIPSVRDCAELPEVSRRLDEWLLLPPGDIAPRIDLAVAAMAGRMARWAHRNWVMQSMADLDRYCADVSGAMFVLLDDLWAWDGYRIHDRRPGMRCGMAVQLAHIVRGRTGDLDRGVDFFPVDRVAGDVLQHAEQSWPAVARYLDQLPAGPVHDAVTAVLSSARPASGP